MADYRWPAADRRALIGKRISRLDGPWKAGGTATYTYDVHREGMLFGRMVLCPHAHAKVKSIDTSAAEKMPGVKAIEISMKPGDEVLFSAQEIVAIAAETEEQARDAVRAVRVEYDVLPHLVADTSPEKAGAENSKPLAEGTGGDPDAAFAKAEVVCEGEYGTKVITHCCLESHGQVCEWDGDQLTVWASTQSVSSIGGEYSEALKIPATNVRIITPVMGGGFGSKFQADRWGILTREIGEDIRASRENDAGARSGIEHSGRASFDSRESKSWRDERWNARRVGLASMGNFRSAAGRKSAASLYFSRSHCISHQAHFGADEHGSDSSVARAESSAMVPGDDGRAGRYRGENQYGSAGFHAEKFAAAGFGDWRRSESDDGRANVEGVSRRTFESRGADGLEKEMASARKFAPER